MGGDARLPEACDFLEFMDGQFIPLQQGDDAESGRVGESPERFQGCGHAGYSTRERGLGATLRVRSSNVRAHRRLSN